MEISDINPLREGTGFVVTATEEELVCLRDALQESLDNFEDEEWLGGPEDFDILESWILEFDKVIEEDDEDDDELEFASPGFLK